MYVKSDFKVNVGDFLVSCKGIVSFREDGPFVWYKADESGNCLLWDIQMGDRVVNLIPKLVDNVLNDKIWKDMMEREQIEIRTVRDNIFNCMFHNELKGPLIEISQSDLFWRELGGDNVYARYFPKGLGVALKDLWGGCYSWKKDCEGNEVQEVEPRYFR